MGTWPGVTPASGVSPELGAEVLLLGSWVVEVAEDSPAAEQQIQAGDVITKVNRRPVRTPKEFRAVMKDSDLKKGVSVTIVGERGRSFRVLKDGGE